MQVQMYENPQNPFFDNYRNRLYSDSATHFLKRVCFLSTKKSFIFSFLAYVIIFLVLISLLILVIFTFLRKDFHDIGSLWKYWLNNWILVQLVALLLLLGLYLPCCVEKFLQVLFNYAIKWNHGLRGLINNINEGDDYLQ